MFFIHFSMKDLHLSTHHYRASTRLNVTCMSTTAFILRMSVRRSFLFFVYFLVVIPTSLLGNYKLKKFCPGYSESLCRTLQIILLIGQTGAALPCGVYLEPNPCGLIQLFVCLNIFTDSFFVGVSVKGLNNTIAFSIHFCVKEADWSLRFWVKSILGCGVYRRAEVH